MMVTLSDRKSQHFRFPNLDVSIDVCLSDGKPVHVDIVFPSDLFAADFDAARWGCSTNERLPTAEAANRRHAVCNRLQIAAMTLDILQQPFDVDDWESIDRILEMAIESLSYLEDFAG